MQKLCTWLKAVDSHVLVYLRAETLFKFKYDTENHCSECDLNQNQNAELHQMTQLYAMVYYIKHVLL